MTFYKSNTTNGNNSRCVVEVMQACVMPSLRLSDGCLIVDHGDVNCPLCKQRICTKTYDFTKYTKMLNMGVPQIAVEHRMVKDGIDESAVIKFTKDNKQRKLRKIATRRRTKTNNSPKTPVNTSTQLRLSLADLLTQIKNLRKVTK